LIGDWGKSFGLDHRTKLAWTTNTVLKQRGIFFEFEVRTLPQVLLSGWAGIHLTVKIKGKKTRQKTAAEKLHLDWQKCLAPT